MRRLNSAEFAREYRSLTEPVLVTRGNKSIGVWTPTIHRLPDFDVKTIQSGIRITPRTWHGYTPRPPLVWDMDFEYPKDPNER